ncbi:MAG: Omp28-related outer membrane protein [Paludibacteraceae bacterium]|nr:Omp28-related outer membrane protein [Paludibacteraceae bacterium]
MKTKFLKNTLLLLLASAMLIFSACNPEDPTNPWEGDDNTNTSSTKLIGYCGNNIDVNIAAGQMARLGGGTTLPKAMFGDSKYIVGARVYIGAEATDTKIFISADLQTNLYEQAFEVIPNAWNYVKFTTPFELTDDLAGVYIGYIGMSDGAMLGMESGEFQYNSGNMGMDIYYDSTEDDKWQFFTKVGAYGYKGKLGIQAVVAGGDYSAETQNNLTIANVKVDAKLPINTANNVKFDIFNYGIRAVNQVLVEYNYNNEKKLIYLNNLDLWNGMGYTVNLSDLTTPSQEGTYPLSISISARNITDDIPADNQYSINQEIYASGFQRKVLVEKFTGQSCSACPNGAEIIKATRAAFEGRSIEVAHHEGFGKDAFTIDESIEYANFFYSQPKFSPAIMIDRNVANSENPESVVGRVNDNETPLFTEAVLSKALESIAPLNVNITHTYNEANRQLSVTVSGEAIQALPNARVNVWLTQSNIKAFQLKGGDDYSHDHAIRATLTGTWGQELVLTPENKYEMTFRYQLPEKIGDFDVVIEDMEIVAFVADYDATSSFNCRVHNAESAPLKK